MTSDRIPGLVISGYGSFYQVRLSGGRVVECKARGRLRQTHQAILTGDEVLISEDAPGKGQIEAILPRANQLHRPHIANVDQAVIVLAWHLPDYDLLLLDNMLLMCASCNVEPIICFNKIDLMREEEEADLAAIRECYAAANIPVLAISAKGNRGLSQLRRYLLGRRTVLAGPSGVGKSSLLNRLLPEENATVGQVSERLQRGKHTTRYVRLLPLAGDEQGGMIADTPGFFVLDPPEGLTAERLPTLYPEYERLYHSDEGCRFDGCRHHREPDCAVRAAVNEGELDKERYQRYLRILQEISLRQGRY